jgi:Fur family transcriptional regulator, peroxide stress response regulator
VKQHRRTRQLAAIYAVVSAAHDHPTAETVHARVRRTLPHVSLGTVYRNLQKLAAMQQVRVVQLADRAARYDGMLDAHDHFLCERCGLVTDLVRTGRARPDCSALRRAGYVVRGHALTLYGCCPKCRDASTE